MEALSMLSPDQRCVRSKLQLFLRLWVARQKYEQHRPFGPASADRIRFHLKSLRDCWEQVLSYQKALGLEIVHFSPNEQFEMIYVVTAFVDRELKQPGNTIIDIHGRWQAYQQWFTRLSYELNPYEFGEICTRCFQIIAALVDPREPEPELISLQSQERACLGGRGAPPLRMKDDPEEKLLGFRTV